MKSICGMVIAVVAVVVLTLSGCGFRKLLADRFEKPTFTYTGFEQVESSQSGMIVNFLFTAHNPNDAGLKSIVCSYVLFVEEKKLLIGQDIPLALDPNGDTAIKVPATIAYKDLSRVLGSVLRRILSGQKTIPLTIEAVFTGKPAIYSESGKDRQIAFEKRVIKTVDIPLQQERKNKGQ